MVKVGRPKLKLTNEERLEHRRNQWRESKVKTRKLQKLLKEIYKPRTIHQVETEYQNGLVNLYKKYDFDYFFTGTLELNKIEKENLRINNKLTLELNREFNIELPLECEKRIGIKSLRKYTEKYLDYLLQKNLLERSFVVFENGKNNKYHTHILMKSNSKKINTDLITQYSWLLGGSLTIPVLDKEKENVLKYMVKELKPSSTKTSDQNKIDSWFFKGDFNNRKRKKTGYVSKLKFTLTS
jgi:hypothetical protein